MSEPRSYAGETRPEKGEGARRLAATILVAAAFAFPSGAGDALAAYPGSDGKLLVTKDRAVHLVDADGANASRVSSPGGGEQTDGSAKISGNGERVAFLRATEAAPPGGCHPTLSCYPTTKHDLYAVDADGSDERLVKEDWRPHDAFDVSPDGRQAIGIRQGSTETGVVAVDLASGDERHLGSIEGRAWNLDLSPDGRRIAFDMATAGGAEDVYVSDLDGSGLERLTSDGADPDRLEASDRDPEWSPDGGRLAFLRVERYRDGSGPQDAVSIRVLGAGGFGPEEVWSRGGTNGRDFTVDEGPIWSPSGDRLGFGVKEGGYGTAYRYFFADPEGTQQLSSTEDIVRPSDWQALPGSSGGQPVPPAPAPNTKPVIARPAPVESTRDRTPVVSAVVRDGQTDLRRANVRLYVDGRRVVRFSYDPATDRVRYSSPRLRKGQHSVVVAATDEWGLVAVRRWGFRVR